MLAYLIRFLYKRRITLDYSKSKELLKDFNEFFKDQRAVSKIVSFLLLVQSLLFILSLFIHYWNIFELVNLPLFPMFNNDFRLLLNNYTFGLLWFEIIYYVLLKYIFDKIIINLQFSIEIKLLPLCNTIEDILEIVIELLLIMFFTNYLIEYNYGIITLDVFNDKVFVMYFCIFAFRIFCWFYAKNANYWNYVEKRYTPYFDCEGSRIPEESSVIYNSKLYEVSLIKKNNNYLSDKGKWYLVEDTHNGWMSSEILLEDAVKDGKGKIKICKFRMGEEI
jgi:hypothetical protein